MNDVQLYCYKEKYCNVCDDYANVCFSDVCRSNRLRYIFSRMFNIPLFRAIPVCRRYR